MPNPTAAALIIGDEILTGRTREGNGHFLAGVLAQTGIDLKEIRVIGDDHATIVAAVRELAAGHDHLFTSGGIGPTHDDITADAVADAFGATISIRDDAYAILAAHYATTGMEFNAARQRMARIPAGARLIDNPVSAAPGFSLGNTYVMAGVPNIFQAMVASVLPTLTGGKPLISLSLRVMQAESSVAQAFGALAARMPDISMGSYPFVKDGAYGTNLVVRGTDAARVEAGHAQLRALFPEGQ
ncbi:competence/damage-inducible protein A [Phaeovulum sp.]|uniref:competence/damage-inducible protein A n=1 Tax=Phaeovulum sp. TaxID=2934796 RepID=UPI0039E3B7F4